MSGWAEAFMTLRVDSKQVKRDVEDGLKSAKGDDAGKQVGGEFSKSFAGEFTSGWRGFHTRFVKDSGDSGKAAGGEGGRSFGSAFSALSSGVARSFWDGFRNHGATEATAAGKDHGQRYGNEFERAFRDTLGRMAKLLGGFSGEEGVGPRLGARAAGGFGPGILGLSPFNKVGAISGAVIAGTAAAPALFAGAGALGVGALGAGAIGLGAKELIGTKNTKGQPATQGPLYDQAQAVQKSFQATMAAAVKPMTEPLKAAMAQIPGILKGLTPQLQAVFGAAGGLVKPLLAGLTDIAHAALPGIAAALKAVAPLLKPLLDGFAQLIKGLLPGLVALLHAAMPAVTALAQILGGLGKAVGAMFTAFAPAIKASAVVLKAIGDVINALFPVIGQLAAVLAGGLAPIFVQLGAAVRALMPFLVLVGKALASLGTVMLGVVSAGLGALVKLLQAIAPALTAFAGMLNQIFTVLENKNVFQMLATAVESVIPAIATLVNSLLGALMPILPPLIDFMVKLAGMIAGALGNALQFVMPLLVQLATTVLGAIARILPAILPAILGLVNALGAGLGKALAVLLPPLVHVADILVGALAKILPALVPLLVALAASLTGGLLSAVMALLPPLTQLAVILAQEIAVVLPVLVPIFAKLFALFTGAVMAVIQGIATALAAILSAIPPPVLAGIVTAIGGIVLGVKAWAIAQVILNSAFLSGPWGWIVLALAAITIAVVLLVQHWNTVWRTIKDVAKDAWEFLTHGWGQFIFPGLTAIRLAVEFVRTHWRDAWQNMINIGKNFWTWLWTDFGAKIGGFFTTTIPHWYDLTVGATKKLWTGVAGAFTTGWNAVWAHTITPMANFFLTTIPHWWALEIQGAKNLWTSLGNVFRDGWNWIWNHTITPMETLFTKTLPGWFKTAVTLLGQFWQNLGNAVRKPVAWVVDNVLNGLISTFDWITSHIGLGSPIKAVHPFGLAGGGRITRGTTSLADDVLVRVSRDETIVSAEHSGILAPAFAALGVPGYQHGGIPAGQNAPGQVIPGAGSRFGPIPGVAGVAPQLGHDAATIAHKALDAVKLMAAFTTGNAAAFTNAFADLVGARATSAGTGMLSKILVQIPKTIGKDFVDWIMGKSATSGSGSAIADYAASFIGKIPYVWGGTAVPGGADCSGFVQAIYRHFGIDAPRTSEAQGAWVKRTGPQTGGLAFYHSPPGGPDPGHVAIIRTALQVISQGGGMGPQLMGLHDMPLLWTGIPPGGLPGAGGGKGVPGTSAQVAAWVQQALGIAGAPLSWLAAMETLVGKESGGNAGAINPAVAGLSGEHAEGIAQTIPATFAAYAMPGHGNIFNPVDNLIASIRYIMGTWKTPFAIPGLMGGGTYMGYAGGGTINEPITGLGAYTGTLYTFGEHGREYVIPEGALGRGGAPAGGTPLIGTYQTAYYGTGDVTEAMRELAFTLRRARQGAFYQPGQPG